MLRIRTLTGIFLFASLAACGGGRDDDRTAVPADYLSKYQGTWWEGCSSQIVFSANDSGPASIRRKLIVSAANASGAVTLDLIEEFFQTQLPCWDETSPPYATVRATQLTTATYSGQLPYPVIVGNALFDVLNQTRPASAVLATGTGISSVTANGTLVWRITFSDGKSIDRPQTAAAVSGVGLPLLRVTANAGSPSQFHSLTVGGSDLAFFQR